MARDYSWARRTAPRGWLTLGDLAELLAVGRHQARRKLLQSGLPCRLFTRRWRDPVDGCWYKRRFWALRRETADLLFELELLKLGREAHRGADRLEARLATSPRLKHPPR